jgi:hypothetical protein
MVTKYILWVIDLDAQYMAFEIEPPQIKYLSVRGIFNRCLNRLPQIGLEIGDFIETAKFKAWVNDIQKITLFRTILRVPNPHWASHPKRIQDLFIETNGDTVKIEVKKSKDSDNGIITKNNIVEDAVTYGESGFSDIYATGERNKQKEYFNSLQNSPSEKVNLPKPANDNSRLDLLKEKLRNFVIRKHGK